MLKCAALPVSSYRLQSSVRVAAVPCGRPQPQQQQPATAATAATAATCRAGGEGRAPHLLPCEWHITEGQQFQARVRWKVSGGVLLGTPANAPTGTIAHDVWSTIVPLPLLRRRLIDRCPGGDV